MKEDNFRLLNQFTLHLKQEERSGYTIGKYERDIKNFLKYVENQEITKELVIEWKEELAKDYAASSVNSMLASLNSFFRWAQLSSCRVRQLRIQRKFYAEPEKELEIEEFKRLVKCAEQKENERLALILQTICATGVRISELCYINVESLASKSIIVDCKGKRRTIFLPQLLCAKLDKYCVKNNITKGCIFCTRSGTPLDRSNIWREMKQLCKNAGVEETKVFPHNLRHLFARMYYQFEKDISKLADLLGHSNISTTRIYIIESGSEHLKQIERLGSIIL